MKSSRWPRCCSRRQRVVPGRKGQKAAAVLRQALAVNPHHLRAAELLAEILIAQGHRGARARRGAAGAGEAAENTRRWRSRGWCRCAWRRHRRPRTSESGSTCINRSWTSTRGMRPRWRARGRCTGTSATGFGTRRARGRRRSVPRGGTGGSRQGSDGAASHDRAQARARDGSRSRTDGAVRGGAGGDPEAGDTYAALTDWAEDVARLTQAAQLLADYHRARGALKAGDRETAMRLFAGIVATEPKYKEAAKLLYEAVSGRDVDRLVARLVAGEKKLAEWEPPVSRLGLTMLAVLGVGLLVGGRVMGRKTAPGQTPAPAQPAASAAPTGSALSAPAAGLCGRAPPNHRSGGGGESGLRSSGGRVGRAPPGSCPEGMASHPRGGRSRWGRTEISDEKPPHDVTVAAFCMDLTQVTVKAYSDATVARRPRRHCCTAMAPRRTEQDHPINCVNWQQARPRTARRMTSGCRAKRSGSMPPEEAARGGASPGATRSQEQLAGMARETTLGEDNGPRHAPLANIRMATPRGGSTTWGAMSGSGRRATTATMTRARAVLRMNAWPGAVAGSMAPPPTCALRTAGSSRREPTPPSVFVAPAPRNERLEESAFP